MAADVAAEVVAVAAEVVAVAAEVVAVAADVVAAEVAAEVALVVALVVAEVSNLVLVQPLYLLYLQIYTIILYLIYFVNHQKFLFYPYNLGLEEK